LAVLVGARNPTGQTVSLKKGFLRKLDLFIFSRSLPGGLTISLLSNPVVVCRPLSSFLLIVRCPILRAVIVRRLCHPPLLSSTVAVVIVRRRQRLPPPSSASAAITATPCLCCLLPPALVLPLCSLPLNLACCCRPPLLLSAFAIVVRRSHLPLPQPSSPLRCLRRLSPPALVLPHSSPPPNHACHCRPPPSSSAVPIPTLVLPPTRC
jgi:hypothetical protein